MKEALEAIATSPLPTILGIGGIMFLFLALVGKVGGDKIILILPPDRQKWLALAGTALLLAAIFLYVLPFLLPSSTPATVAATNTPTATSTPTPTPTNTPTPTAIPTDTPTPTPTNTPTPTPVVIDTMDDISGWSVFSDALSTIEIRSISGMIDDAVEISYTLTANGGNWVMISRPVNMQPLSGTTKGIRFFCSGSGKYNTIELKLLYAPDDATGQSVTFVKSWPAATVADRRSLEVLYTEFDCGKTCPPNGQLDLGEVRTIDFAISNAEGGDSGSGTVAIDHVVGFR